MCVPATVALPLSQLIEMCAKYNNAVETRVDHIVITGVFFIHSRSPLPLTHATVALGDRGRNSGCDNLIEKIRRTRPVQIINILLITSNQLVRFLLLLTNFSRSLEMKNRDEIVFLFKTHLWACSSQSRRQKSRFFSNCYSVVLKNLLLHVPIAQARVRILRNFKTLPTPKKYCFNHPKKEKLVSFLLQKVVRW